MLEAKHFFPLLFPTFYFRIFTFHSMHNLKRFIYSAVKTSCGIFKVSRSSVFFFPVCVYGMRRCIYIFKVMLVESSDADGKYITTITSLLRYIQRKAIHLASQRFAHGFLDEQIYVKWKIPIIFA